MTPPPRDTSADASASDFSLPGVHPLPAQHSMYKHHILTVEDFTKEKVRHKKIVYSIVREKKVTAVLLSTYCTVLYMEHENTCLISGGIHSYRNFALRVKIT